MNPQTGVTMDSNEILKGVNAILRDSEELSGKVQVTNVVRILNAVPMKYNFITNEGKVISLRENELFEGTEDAKKFRSNIVSLFMS